MGEAAVPTIEGLADLEVEDIDGKKRRVGDLWKERTAVLVFVRHFGWPFCREQAAQLRRELPKIREAGADLVVIGSGTPDMARDFEREHGQGLTILVDQGLKSFKAAGLKRGVLRTLGPRPAIKVFGALFKGYTPSSPKGDPWQQGGVLAIAPPGELAYSYANDDSSDHAPIEDVLGALAKV